MRVTHPRSQGGRPSKGPRRYLSSRVPLDLAHAVIQKADEQDLHIGDYIGNLLAEAHGFPPVAAPKSKDEEDELPLKLKPSA